MRIEDAIDKEITYLLNYAADILDEQIRRRDRVYGIVNLEATRLQIASYKRIVKDLRE
jgi:hypothetical protein